MARQALNMTGYPRLLVDMGGTHSRLQWQAGPRHAEPPARVRNDDYAGPLALLQSCIADHGRPARVAIAVAAPVLGGPVRLTNRPAWVVDPAQLGLALGGAKVDLLNDFTALAFGIPALASDARLQIGAGQPGPGAPLAVLGPGTGLGVSGLLPVGAGWVPIDGEGGHVTLPAVTADEFALIRAVAGENGHVSAEYLLSGAGLVRLYHYYRTPDTPAATEPEAVTRRAAEDDPVARKTLATFFALLGTVAGDLALTLGARGGVYLAGGILPQIRDALLASSFRARFVAKGRYRDYLDAIPTYLITDPFLSLRGLAAWLDQQPEA